jgi:hypothetical protein
LLVLEAESAGLTLEPENVPVSDGLQLGIDPGEAPT